MGDYILQVVKINRIFDYKLVPKERKQQFLRNLARGANRTYRPLPLPNFNLFGAKCRLCGAQNPDNWVNEIRHAAAPGTHIMLVKIHFKLYRKSTPCFKKVSCLMFDNNFSKKNDFHNSFTMWFVKKFCMYASQRFPPHLQYVATLPCEVENPKKCYEIFTLKVTMNMFN